MIGGEFIDPQALNSEIAKSLKNKAHNQEEPEVEFKDEFQKIMDLLNEKTDL